jgi:1,4-alpha-glucan branching enzyme
MVISQPSPSLKKEFLKRKSVCKVTFTLPETIRADSAYLVGDFNNWNQVATPMKKMRGGQFSVTLELEKGHEYQFRYLVNGTEWLNAEQADKYVPNAFGGENSVVIT